MDASGFIATVISKSLCVLQYNLPFRVGHVYCPMIRRKGSLDTLWAVSVEDRDVGVVTCEARGSRTMSS